MPTFIYIGPKIANSLYCSSPLDGVFGLGEWHQASVVAGGGAALEVDALPDTALIQLLILQHAVPVADTFSVQLIQCLEQTALFGSS